MCTISTCIYTVSTGYRRGPGGTKGPPVTLRPSVLSTGDMHRYAYNKYTVETPCLDAHVDALLHPLECSHPLVVTPALVPLQEVLRRVYMHV
jgi:hypothetical protein